MRNRYYNMFGKNNIEKEEKETKRRPNVKRGLIILATVGVGCGVYGWVNGRTSGYRDGYRRGRLEGMTYTVDNFAEALGEVIKEAKESKGE